MALDDHRRLGHISGFLSVQSPAVWVRMTSPSPRRNVPSCSPSPTGTPLYMPWRTSTLAAAYWAKGDYRQASDCLKQTVTSLHGAQRRERLGQATLPSVHRQAFLAPRVMLSLACLLRAVCSGKKDCRLLRQWRIPAA